VLALQFYVVVLNLYCKQQTMLVHRRVLNVRRRVQHTNANYNAETCFNVVASCDYYTVTLFGLLTSLSTQIYVSTYTVLITEVFL